MNEYETKMIEAFVNKPDKPEKGFWYVNSFEKYNLNGIDSMKWNWSWWAFFGGLLFLLYRKSYAAAGALFLISLVLGLIPFAGLIVSILAGGYSSYFVYKTYKKKKLAIEAMYSDEDQRIAAMRVSGGYNTWVLWILPALFILGIVAAVAIPQLAYMKESAIQAQEAYELSTQQYENQQVQ